MRLKITLKDVDHHLRGRYDVLKAQAKQALKFINQMNEQKSIYWAKGPNGVQWEDTVAFNEYETKVNFLKNIFPWVNGGIKRHEANTVWSLAERSGFEMMSIRLPEDEQEETE